MSEKNITIAGSEFAVSQPYAAGHAITEAEAKALNQVRAENIRNNMAPKVKIAMGEAPTSELNPNTIAGLVAVYDAEYVFTLASVGAGKRPTDPVEVEALRIARETFAAFCAGKGLTVKAVKAKIGDDAYEGKLAELAARENIVKEAKRRVKSRTEQAANALGDFDMSGLKGAEPVAEGEAAPAE